VGADGKLVAPFLVVGLVDDDNCRDALARAQGLDHDLVRMPGELVDLLAHVLALDEVDEVRLARDGGEDRRGEGVPLHHGRSRLGLCAVVHQQVGAVGDRVAFFLPRAGVEDDQLPGPRDGDPVPLLVDHRGDVEVLDLAGVVGDVARLLAAAGRGAAVVEGAHGQLGPWFADGLGCDDTHRLADLHHASGGEHAPVAQLADPALCLAGEHRADAHPLDAGLLDVVGDDLRDLGVHGANEGALDGVVDVLRGDAADDAVAQRLENLAALGDGSDLDAPLRPAVHLDHDHVL